MVRIVLAGVLVLSSMTGCRLGPKYHYPVSYIPDDWKAPVKEEASCPTVEYWWEVFEDDTLNQIECYAVNNSPTLELAVQHVMEALAIAKATRAALAPQLTLNPSFLDYGQLFQFFVPPGFSPLIGENSVAPFRIHQYQLVLPLVLNYEIDLWGKIHNQADAACYQAQASMFDYEVAMLTLTSNIASTYFQIRMIDAQILILEKTVEWRRVQLDLVQSRYKIGVVNLQDVTSAQLQLANTEEMLLDVQRQRGDLEDVLATFAGISASEFCLPFMPLAGEPPVISPGTPSEIMLKRPDIREAERLNAAQNALVGAAYASFFPSLSLSTILGYNSPTLKDFMTWNSRQWQIGADSTQTIVDGGRNCGNLEAAWARFKQANAQYQQTVLTAFQEVEQSLNALNYEEKQYKKLLEAEKAANTTANLSESRYKKGLVNYLDVSVNDLNSLNAELNTVNMLGMRYVATVQLIKAIGGSWTCAATLNDDERTILPQLE